MAVEPSLADGWRAGLRAALELTHAPIARRRWMARAQVRVYRFLLRVYPDAERRTPTEPPIATLQGPELDSDHDPGLPARSAHQVRSSLKRIHAVRPKVATGPDQGPPNWEVVACSSTALDWRRCVAMLARHGIRARASKRGGVRQVEVARADFDPALELIATYRSEIAPSRHASTRHWLPVVEPVRSRLLLTIFAFMALLLLGYLYLQRL